MNYLLGNFWFLLFASITIVTVAVALVSAWVMVRGAEAATAWKQAMLARGLSVGEMERLLRADASVSDDRLVYGMVGRLGQLSASGETIRTVLEAFQAADPSGKRVLSRAISAVCAMGKRCDEQVLGIIHGLSRPDGAAREIGQNSEPRLAQQTPGTGGKWDSQAIRAEKSDANSSLL
jgi:hypothetical protein